MLYTCAPHCWLSRTCIKYYQAALINSLPQLCYCCRTILILTLEGTQDCRCYVACVWCVCVRAHACVCVCVCVCACMLVFSWVPFQRASCTHLCLHYVVSMSSVHVHVYQWACMYICTEMHSSHCLLFTNPSCIHKQCCLVPVPILLPGKWLSLPHTTINTHNRHGPHWIVIQFLQMYL